MSRPSTPSSWRSPHKIKRSFSNNGRQPTAEELAIAERVRAAVRSCAAYLATMEPARAQIAAAHAQLVAVTAQIERSFSDNGRQPTAEELAIAERVRAAVRSYAAYLATTEPARAQIAAAHAQLMAAYSKDMADTNGEMLAEYSAWGRTAMLARIVPAGAIVGCFGHA